MMPFNCVYLDLSMGARPYFDSLAGLVCIVDHIERLSWFLYYVGRVCCVIVVVVVVVIFTHNKTKEEQHHSG